MWKFEILHIESQRRYRSMNYRSFICLLVLISLILFVAGCGSSISDNHFNELQPQAQHVEVLTSVKQQAYHVGETFKIGDLQYTINGIRTSEGNSKNVILPKEGNTYLLINLMIENKGTSDVEVRSLVGFKLKDKFGRKQAFSMGAFLAVNHEMNGTIATGGKMTGEIGYEVVNEPQTFELIITPNPFSSEYAVVKIPLEMI
ncbi:DUF4352 domain-containing protein [Desulfosporosinus sp. SB140]|uniref:DUF4352 domain-containing protein n=1 Tax=Desulfosporosinus paludis TaxID=3115649 RepID=UPI00388F605D